MNKTKYLYGKKSDATVWCDMQIYNICVIIDLSQNSRGITLIKFKVI